MTTRAVALDLAPQHKPEDTIALPSLAWLPASEGRVVDDDVLGALELAIVLAPAGLPRSTVVQHWRGDRYAVLALPDASHASLWLSRWSTPESARKVAAAFERLRDPARRIARHGSIVLVARALSAATFTRALHELTRESGPSARAIEGSSPHKRGLPLASSVHGN